MSGLYKNLFKGIPEVDGKEIDQDYYSDVPSPKDIEVTNKLPKIKPGPNSKLMDKIAAFDAIAKRAASGDIYKLQQNDQGPGTKNYNDDSPFENLKQLRDRLATINKK